MADDLWFCLNQRHFSNKSHHVAAAVPEDNDELEEAVAVLNMQPKLHQPKKKASKPGKFGDQTWKCASPSTCTWSGNE